MPIKKMIVEKKNKGMKLLDIKKNQAGQHDEVLSPMLSNIHMPQFNNKRLSQPDNAPIASMLDTYQYAGQRQLDSINNQRMNSF